MGRTMNARELYKKNLPLIMAWANGAEIEGRNTHNFYSGSASSKWHVVEYPSWWDSDYEFRIKPEAPKPMHYLSSCGALCGSADSLHEPCHTDLAHVTCATCLAKEPGASTFIHVTEDGKVVTCLATLVHFVVEGLNKAGAPCAFGRAGYPGVDDWSKVTCPACLAKKPKAALPDLPLLRHRLMQASTQEMRHAIYETFAAIVNHLEAKP